MAISLIEKTLLPFASSILKHWYPLIKALRKKKASQAILDEMTMAMDMLWKKSRIYQGSQIGAVIW